MILVPWQPALTKDELIERSDPVVANQPEILPWQLYDTATIANGAAGPFVFFQAINADKTLSNMDGPGQLPDPQYFRIHYIACDLLQIPTVSAHVLPVAAANVENILKTCRAAFTLNMSNKRYGSFPLTMCHATGGVTGAAYGYGASVAGNDVFAPNNGVVGSGGYPFGGSVLLPPKMPFDVTVFFATGVTATLSANLNNRISLVGILYRRVL